MAGRYRVLRTLGRGGMGSVVEVLDLKTDRLRALKLMRAELAVDASLRARFELEAMVAGRVESEHVIEVLDAGIDEATGSPYLVMELLRGDDLGALVKRDGPLSPERALLYLGQIAMGLERTHADHVVHRDLKPENLFVSQRDDGSPRIKILDFGVAKVIATSGAQSTRSLGTPLYMAPEQLTGDGSIDARADLYALGHVTFAILTGAPYFAPEHDRADNLYALALQMARGPSEPATSRARSAGVTLPTAFDAWFVKAVAPAVDERFESASDLVRALAEALELPAPAMRSERDPEPRRGAVVANDDAMTTPDSPSFLTPTVAAAPLAEDARPARDPASALHETSSTGVAIPSGSGRPSSTTRWLAAGSLAALGVVAVLAFRTSDETPSHATSSGARLDPAPSATSSHAHAARSPASSAPTESASAVATTTPSIADPTAAVPAERPLSPRRSTGVVAPSPAVPSAPAAPSAAGPAPATSPSTRPVYDPLRDF